MGKVSVAEAALGCQTPCAVGLRNIGEDAVFLARLQRGASGANLTFESRLRRVSSSNVKFIKLH
jgi:hypothetical protein